MSSDAFDIIYFLFNSGWAFFTTFRIPVLGFSIGGFLIFSLTVVLVIRILKYIVLSVFGGDSDG